MWRARSLFFEKVFPHNLHGSDFAPSCFILMWALSPFWARYTAGQSWQENLFKGSRSLCWRYCFCFSSTPILWVLAMCLVRSFFLENRFPQTEHGSLLRSTCFTDSWVLSEVLVRKSAPLILQKNWVRRLWIDWTWRLSLKFVGKHLLHIWP